MWSVDAETTDLVYEWFVFQINRGMIIYVCFLQGATTETVYKMG